MPETPRACLSCGAALPPGAERCALCGTPAGMNDDPTAASEVPRAQSGPPAPGAGANAARPLAGACPACGHANPPGARFCNACGAALAEAPALPPETPEASLERPPSDVGKRAVVFVGVALAAVVALYAGQVLLGGGAKDLAPAPNTAQARPDGAPGAAEPIPDGPAPPLPDARLQAEADSFEAAGDARGLLESGRYYLTAAYDSFGENPVAGVQWARRAAELFEQSVGVEDTDAARLALAEALRVDPQRSQPMRPIEEVRTVLDRSPANPTALFIMGELRLERASFEPAWEDSARVMYERVVQFAPRGDLARDRAERRLAELDSLARGSAGAP